LEKFQKLLNRPTQHLLPINFHAQSVSITQSFPLSFDPFSFLHFSFLSANVFSALKLNSFLFCIVKYSKERQEKLTPQRPTPAENHLWAGDLRTHPENLFYLFVTSKPVKIWVKKNQNLFNAFSNVGRTMGWEILQMVHKIG
jgi:hypothetical protein